MFVTFKKKYVLFMYWLYAGMQEGLLQPTFIMYLLYGYFVDSAENLRRDSWEKNNSIKGDVGGGGTERNSKFSSFS
jgi:hypothetical protein